MTLDGAMEIPIEISEVQSTQDTMCPRCWATIHRGVKAFKVGDLEYFCCQTCADEEKAEQAEIASRMFITIV